MYFNSNNVALIAYLVVTPFAYLKWSMFRAGKMPEPPPPLKALKKKTKYDTKKQKIFFYPGAF